MRNVHLEGFRTQQVWEQARRVLDATIHEIETHLKTLQPSQNGGQSLSQLNLHDKGEPPRKRVKFVEVDPQESEKVHNPHTKEVVSEDIRDIPDLGADVDESSIGNESEGIEDRLDGTDEEEDVIETASDQSSDDGDGQPGDVFFPDKHGLNDGFFSIDDFNKQTEFLEHQDARGEPDNEVSDEEEIEWGAEPPPVQRNDDFEVDEDSAGSDDSEDGPTFGNADLNASGMDSAVSDDDISLGITGATTNTNDIRYTDFFAPPPRKATKSTRLRALPKTQPAPGSATQPEDDINRTIAGVRRDIFEDNLSEGEDSAADPDGLPADRRASRSNHEKRQARLAEEIRKLEAANVAKRDWTLSGEARAADRPLNSLLEEDLDFERAGKPVPVITNDVSEDIEALIKRRIINREFDEVIRRRPGDLVTGASAARRGRFELDDTKPQQSLAEMYEADHMKRVDPAGYVDKRDEKLKKEHAAIESLWADISAKLDSLSNWHYKPKPPQASFTVVSDVPKVNMEDARPSAGEGMGAEESMLAPQEVYKPGEERSREDKQKVVVLKSGLPVAREEMGREEKLRRRRREKERIKKKGGSFVTKEATAGVKRATERKGVVGDLKRAGVKVIGKKGELVDMEGKGILGSQGDGEGGGSFKL